MKDQFEVEHDPTGEKFTIDFGGKEGVLAYTLVNNVMDMYLLFIPENFRGQGFSSKLVMTAFSYAQKQGFKVIPTCPYVKDKFLKEHTEYQKMITENYF